MALQHAGEAIAHFRVGSPTIIVRVTSVVPSGYWPPESIRNISFLLILRLLDA